MGQLVGITAALALIAYVGLGTGVVDFFFPPQAEVTSSSSGEPAADSLQYVLAHTQLSHPLGYSATVRDCLPSGRDCTRTRFYFAKSQEAK